MQQQNVIDDLIAQMTQVQSPYSAFSAKTFISGRSGIDSAFAIS